MSLGFKLATTIALVAATLACEPAVPPNENRAHVGVVLSTDWHDRSFVLEEDGTRTVIWLRSCAGEMPIWPKQHILIHYHVSHDPWVATGCQIFDWVQRVGPDIR